MKKIFFVIIAIFAIGSSQVVAEEVPKKGTLEVFISQIVATAPVLLYATVNQCADFPDLNYTQAKLSILQVFRGDLSRDSAMTVFFVNAAKGSKYTRQLFLAAVKNHDSKIFILNKDQNNRWQASILGLDVIPSTNKIVLGNIQVSFSDFKIGIAIFKENYLDFQQKKQQNISFYLENPRNNQTYAFLTREMMGTLLLKAKKTIKKRKK